MTPVLGTRVLTNKHTSVEHHSTTLRSKHPDKISLKTLSLRGNFLKYKGTRTKEPPSQETRPKIKKKNKTGEERSLGYEYKADMQQILSI